MNFWAYICLCASAFSVPFSLPVGRSFLLLSMLFLIVDLIRERKRPVIPPVAWAGFVLVALLVLVSVLSPYRSASLPKLVKLVWFLGIPITAGLVNTQKRLSGLLGAFSIGTCVLALERCFVCPVRAFAAVERGDAVSVWGELVRIGSMTDGQMLMLGLLVSLGFWLLLRSTGQIGVLWLSVFCLQAAGFVMNLKRGSWFAGGLAIFILLCVKKKWMSLLVMAVVVLSLLALPPVWSRLSGLSGELSGKGGERWAMWTRVAPSLIKKYPWGIGYRALNNRMIVRRAPGFISPHRDHLHSNVVQLLVAGGWLGLCAYLFWMCRAFLDCFLFVNLTWSKPDEDKMNAMLILLMLMALFLNGLIEYNFGDAEIVLVYGFIVGSAAAGANSLKQTSDVCSPGLRVVLQ